jgi:predicted RNA-binding protein with PIN domain
VPYVIDGNNLLGSWGGPSADDDRRGEVVRRVAAFCRARGAKATLVFDGHPLRPDMAAQDLGPLRLRVPPAGVDADTIIREIVDTAERPAELVVVTSDKALYSYAKTAGASVLRVHEWNAIERRLLRTSGPGGAGGDRGPGSGGAGEKPDKEDDVDGWLKRFGGK